MEINSETRLNLVIGESLSHSQSPLLHNTVYQLLNINSILLAKADDNIHTLMQGVKYLQVDLTAVTFPYKTAVINYLDECSLEANILESVNTVIHRHGKLIGYNTDIDGIQSVFLNYTLANKKALILGAGGAARTLAYFLKKQNVHISWFNRNNDKAEILCNKFGDEIVPFNQIYKQPFDIIINTTPVGLFPEISETPLPHYEFQKNQIIFDMVYHPYMTQLLQDALAKEANIISGIDMFIAQGLKQIEILTGKKLPAEQIIKVKSILLDNQEDFAHEKN